MTERVVMRIKIENAMYILDTLIIISLNPYNGPSEEGSIIVSLAWMTQLGLREI